MRFYGRETELKTLDNIRSESKISSRFTVITGRRRIGKTALLLKSVENERHVYMFITRVNESLLCMNLQRELKESGIDVVGRIDRFADILKAVMLHSSTSPITLIIDEFQELYHVNKAIFQEIQDVWDRYKDVSKVNLIVSGSAHSMMTRLFENEKEPLFGRPTAKIVLHPLRTSLLKQILRDHNPDYSNRDLLTLYMLTGGVPLYVSVLMDSGSADADKMLRYALSSGSIFLMDGKDSLITEFGKDYRTYFSILQLISSGKERRSEMEDVLRTECGPYLDRLKNEYGYVENISPVLSKPETKNTRWVISDMYLRFYFRYVHPCSGYVESERYDLLMRTVEKTIADYEGRTLEDYFRRKIAEEDTYTAVGGYWNRKGDIEIDVLVLDDLEKSARAIEVKRNRRRYDEKALREKTEKVEALRGYSVVCECLSWEDM